MNINIYVHGDDGTTFSATARSFDRASEELAALERKSTKIEEFNKNVEGDKEFPF